MMFDRLFEKLLTVETRPSGKVEELWLTPKGKLISASPDHTTDALRRMRKMDKNYKGDENDAYDDIKQEKQFIRVYIGELLVDVGFDIASKITVSQYAKIKKLIKEYELVFFDIYNPKTGKGRSDNGGRELIKAIRDYGLLEAKKNCQKEFIVDFYSGGCSELVMRELLEKTLALSKETSMNEFDIKKALRTAAVTTAIGGAALGIGLQRGATSKEVEKPEIVTKVEAPVAAKEEEIGEWQTINMRVTAYCPGPECTGTDSPGITASGHKIQSGDVFVATDERYPFGTKMVIPGYNDDQPVEVLDRGGAIKGNRIDVFFPTHEEALEWGVKDLDVKIFSD